MIGPGDVGKRVATPADVDGIVVGIGRNYEEVEVAVVELDGHTYGPGRPPHTFPIGTVWLVDTPESAEVGPSWYPVTAAEDTPVTEELPMIVPADAPARQYGDDGWDDYAAADMVKRLRRQHGS